MFSGQSTSRNSRWRVGHVPDLKERLIQLQREPFENRDRVEPVTQTPTTPKVKSPLKALDRWPSKLNESLMRGIADSTWSSQEKKKTSSSVSSFIFRTSEERSIYAFQGSWDLDHVASKAKIETQIKQRFDLCRHMVHGQSQYRQSILESRQITIHATSSSS